MLFELYPLHIKGRINSTYILSWTKPPQNKKRQWVRKCYVLMHFQRIWFSIKIKITTVYTQTKRAQIWIFEHLRLENVVLYKVLDFVTAEFGQPLSLMQPHGQRRTKQRCITAMLFILFPDGEMEISWFKLNWHVTSPTAVCWFEVALWVVAQSLVSGLGSLEIKVTAILVVCESELSLF